MPRKQTHVALLLATIALVCSACPTALGSKAEDRPLLINGIIIPSATGLPFTATVVIEYERQTADGDSETRRTINMIARDSKGRTHNETRRFMPEYFHGSPPLIGVRLFDPQTRLKTEYDPAVHVARRQITANTPTPTTIANPKARTEDLGTTTMNGLKVRGTRHVYKLSHGIIGLGETIEIQDEEWYSEDLHLNLLVRHVDPRIGAETVGVSGLKREEPSASLFEVPQGYKFLDDAQAPRPGDKNSEQKLGLTPED